MNLLIVNLDKTAPNHVILDSLCSSHSYNLAESPRDDPPMLFGGGDTHHRESFAASCVTTYTTCLSVGEYGAVVTLQHTIDQVECSLLVYDLLGRLRTKNIIKGECFSLVLFVRLEYVHLVVLLVDIHAVEAVFMRKGVLFYFYLVLIGRHLIMTFTHYAIQ